MARGDIFTVDLPEPPGEGREQAGRRPAIVIQADTVDARLPTIMVVPLTGRLGAMRFPHTFRVDPSPENGLAIPSVMLVFQLRAIDRRRIIRQIGRLEERYMEQLEEEIRHLLDL